MTNYTQFSRCSLPPANEVWGKVIFSEACVKNSVHGGVYLGRYPPRTGRCTPPGIRQVHPLDQVHPPWDQAGTPPWAVHARRYGQQAGGTHPTGMHSCFELALPVPFGKQLQNSVNRNVSMQSENVHFGQKKVHGQQWLMAHSHCTEPGPGNDILCYVLYCTYYTVTGTGTGNYCFLLYPSRSRVQVPCSVYNPLHIFLTDFLQLQTSYWWQLKVLSKHATLHMVPTFLDLQNSLTLPVFFQYLFSKQ